MNFFIGEFDVNIYFIYAPIKNSRRIDDWPYPWPIAMLLCC